MFSPVIQVEICRWSFSTGDVKGFSLSNSEGILAGSLIL